MYFIVFLISILCIRLSIILPSYRKPICNGIGSISTMIYFGSGGHTSEMLMLIQGISPKKYFPIDCIIAKSDKTTISKVNSMNIQLLKDANWYPIYRSREVKQSWFTTIFSTLYSFFESFSIVFKLKPSLIICNGPGKIFKEYIILIKMYCIYT